MIPMMSEFREKMKNSKDLLAPLVSIYDPSVVENFKELGPDLLIVDMEHSVIDVKALQTILMAAGDIPVLARIRGLEQNEVKKVLDTGVSGIIVPGIRTVEEARKAVQFARLPPVGIRGAGPGRASGYGYHFIDYENDANNSILIIQIETQEAYNDLENILSVKGIDGYFIGPVDLSISLGLKHSWDDPDFSNAIERVVSEGKKRNLIGGMYTPLNRPDYERVKSHEFNFVMFGTDRQALAQTYGASLKEYRDIHLEEINSIGE